MPAFRLKFARPTTALVEWKRHVHQSPTQKQKNHHQPGFKRGGGSLDVARSVGGGGDSDSRTTSVASRSRRSSRVSSVTSGVSAAVNNYQILSDSEGDVMSSSSSDSGCDGASDGDENGYDGGGGVATVANVAKAR